MQCNFATEIIVVVDWRPLLIPAAAAAAGVVVFAAVFVAAQRR